MASAPLVTLVPWLATIALGGAMASAPLATLVPWLATIACNVWYAIRIDLLLLLCLSSRHLHQFLP
jgi:hypothetical protein